MNLVIAEKDMLARDIARAMCGVEVSQDAKLPISGNGYTVCACSGHLLTLEQPENIASVYKEWTLDNLPISFKPWPKVASSDFAQRKLDLIEKLLRECDGTIYHAGDPDDEGQLIVDEVLEHFGYSPSDSRIWRVFINDNIESNIKREFEQARPNAECVSSGWAAQARSLADFCFGINETRLATLKLGKLLTLGRVQTPTLGLVVERDLAREAHTTRVAYTLVVKAINDDGYEFEFKFVPPKDALEDGKHCFNKEYLEGIASQIDGQTISFEVEHKDKTEDVPLPFNFNTLVADLSKREHMTNDDVMQATQSLRDDYKAITYNRTDCSYLKDEHYEKAQSLVPYVLSNLNLELPINYSIKSAAFDSNEVENHHGIIPQEVSFDITKLTHKQQATYVAIALRYLLQFTPACRYTLAQASFTLPGVEGSFKWEAKELLDAGWSAYAPKGWASMGGFGAIPCAGICSLVAHSQPLCSYNTTPPKPFTDGTLTTAMANIARYVKNPETRAILKKKDEGKKGENGSIGTTATRAAIINGLIEHGYLIREKNHLISSPQARKFFEIIPQEISSADLSARWWLLQEDVKTGKLSLDAIMDDVCATFNEHKDSAYVGKSIHEAVGPCPKCGAQVLYKGRSYQCETNHYQKTGTGEYLLDSGCGFSLPVSWSGAKLTPALIAELLSGKVISIKGAISRKTNKKFDCGLQLNSEHKLEPIFSNAPHKASKHSKKKKAFRI